jgi:hypothetical protein
MRKLLILGLLAIAGITYAQPGLRPEQMRKLEDKKPYEGYWQQDVHYYINARIDEETNIIHGNEILLYKNNSADTLNYIYYRLFQNAFVKGSHLRELEAANKVKARLGKYEAAGKGIELDAVQVDGKEVSMELDNTILKIYLPKPLLPGKTMRVTMNFKTYYDNGSTRRRMKMYDAWGFKHYNGCQWFPKVCVYDRKFGWENSQHLNKEFYADFGKYEVALNFPSNYVVEATGELQNRSEVLPDTLRAKLDMKNFAKKKWGEKPSIITPYVKGERKTWKYMAENVHDFAFTADPSYRIATTTWNGIECVGIAQEPHASGWQNSAEYVAKIIKVFSEDIGMYRYPKMVAADASDGMEYPMLTLDGGSDPGYRGLLVHEIAHNWFYGMVGSNETYRAALDEGFTQFLTAWGMRRIDGNNIVEGKPKDKYRRAFYEPQEVMAKRVFDAYTIDALTQQDAQLNTHSNDFGVALHHEGGYRSVYYKTASMLYNLQYTLGDSLFKGAMQHYFKQWCFGHPYFEDFRNSIIQYTKTDLNWFFDQWLETTKGIDYQVGGIKRISGTDSFAIKLKRKGGMQMPVDFTVKAKDGSNHSFHIPNTYFKKDTKATTLPQWYGWGGLNPTYTAHVQVPSGIRNVQLDTTFRLADMDWHNNYKSRNFPIRSKAIKWRIDGGLANPMDRKQYRMYVRPDLWWNPIDGVKAGVHFEGNYLATLHKLDATIWWNSHIGQQTAYKSRRSEGWYDRYVPLNYTFNYTTPVSKQYNKLQLQFNSRLLDGLWYHRGGFNWKPSSKNMVELYAQTMWRPRTFDLDYLIYTNEWSSTRANANSSLNASWSHSYKYVRGTGNYRFDLRAPLLTGNGAGSFNYSYLQGEAINISKLGKLELRTRGFARYGMGNVIPSESALYAAGASPEEMMDNKYTRSIGFVPNDWRGYSSTDMNHFQQGGGLNLRGYAGYLMSEQHNGQLLIGYKARSGAAANLEIDFDELIKFRPKFTRNWLKADIYLFGDAGIMQMSAFPSVAQYWQTQPTTQWSDLRMDAGLGCALTVKKFGIFDKAKPLTLRFDMPLVVNRPPFANPDYLGFRYVVGVNRSF